MDLQEENMLNTGRAVQALVAQVSELTTQVQLLRSPAAPPTPPSFSIPGNHSPQHEPRLPAPEMYAGDPNLCRAFLTKCSLFFSLQPLTFATEVSRVALVLTLLSGRRCGKIAIPVVPRSTHSLRRWGGCSIARWSGARQRACWPISARGSSPFLTIPSSSGPWRQSVSGTRRRSGTCSCMGWPTVSNKRSTWWSYLSGWTNLWIWPYAWMHGFSNAIFAVDASQHRDILSSTPAIRSVTRRLTNPCRWVELGSPGRREIVGGWGGCAYTAARLAISGRAVP